MITGVQTQTQRQAIVQLPNLFDSYNSGYAQEMFELWVHSPGSVDESWRRIFEAAEGDGAQATPVAAVPESTPATSATPAGAPTDAQLRAAMAAAEIVDAYRLHGHLAARLNPLGDDRAPAPSLDPEYHGIDAKDLESIPASALGFEHVGSTMADVLAWLKETYSGSVGYEYEHIADATRRHWLRDQIESGEHRQALSAERKRRLLNRLTEGEALEQFIHRAYLGAKRFSGEGNDMLIPILDVAVEHASTSGAREVLIGMSHRGRLNTLAHVLGMPYARIISEFEGHHRLTAGTGDVKYHLGFEGTYATSSGEPLTVSVAPNPSHLEFVNPVISGMVRAKQTDRTSPELKRNEDAALSIHIHGDAAFAGQGVVPETLNLAELRAYRIGGTVNIIVNNQVGFTTDPRDGRSTRYSSDLARGFDIPIFHVNADDPEACLAVARLALAYRARFHGDVLIDLLGYRRYGHNETDEPAYTQPQMYDTISKHPSVRKIWAERLVADGELTQADVDGLWNAAYQRLVDAQAEVKKAATDNGEKGAPRPEPRSEVMDTAVSATRLTAFDRQLHSWPSGFTVHPKLARQLEKRSKVLSQNGALDWAHAEALAFASLIADGVPIRGSGQDMERGTFSQRHMVLHDAKTGETYAPLAHLQEARAPFEIYNSPLSELAVMGFEYGYSIAAPEALVLWEAQFGDFVNGAQVIIDQFISAGRAKWEQFSRLTLLLPHASEGQGPEHSSARPERFLQLAAEDNMRIANCSTPAQYFHLLRWQALAPDRRPLVLFTPKSLLRHPKAISRLEELTDGSFHPLIDDETASNPRGQISRVVLCTGKVYYDLIGNEARAAATDTAVVRVEMLYPFPTEQLAALLSSYPSLTEVLWAQEEPENDGVWRYAAPSIVAALADRAPLEYVGRPERASPAEGYASSHAQEQGRIAAAAFAPLGSKRGKEKQRRR
jgi:2-oxoglutarate dehydrogenase E1 component